MADIKATLKTTVVFEATTRKNEAPKEMTHDELKAAYHKVSIEKQILSHMCHKVNWAIEQLVASLDKGETNTLLAKQNLRRIQRNHLNYNDPNSMQVAEDLLEEYASLTGFTSKKVVM